jgi:hypothetical protein
VIDSIESGHGLDPSFELDPVRKPVSTFRDHALAADASPWDKLTKARGRVAQARKLCNCGPE